MPSSRIRLIIFIVSVILSSGLLWLGISRMPERVSGNYAVLVFDEAVPDRTVRERLENAGVTGLISESGQYVLLDVFDSLESIPLDEYETRVLPFDPRNDGYAQKLRSLFVRDGKRYFYLSSGFFPLGNISFPGLNKILASEFNDYPYSLEVIKSKTTAAFPLALFGVAVLAFFIIKPLRRGLSPSASLLLPCLPPLVPLATGGAAGFAMAALLAGFSFLLAGFRLEKTQYRNRGSATPPFVTRNSAHQSEKTEVPLRLLLPFLFLACYTVLAFFSGFPLFLSMPVLGIFCGVLIFSMRFTPVGEKVFPNRSNRLSGTGHRRFFPVQIISRKENGLSFAWVMLPFAVPALALAFTVFETSVSSSSGFPFPPPGLISEADWQDHFYFQSSFSDTSLYDADANMSEYEFSQDGLLSPTPHSPLPTPHIPPFPLGGFLSDFDAGTKQPKPVAPLGSHSAAGLVDILSALVPLAFIIPALIYRRFRRGN
jgi:hypothetical protein